MNLSDFLQHFVEQFEETEPQLITKDTDYKALEEWSSLLALNVIAMVDEEYNVIVHGSDFQSTTTIEDLYRLVASKL